MKTHLPKLAPALALSVFLFAPLRAQDKAAPGTEDMAEIAKKLSNPVASLISVPLQSNFDFGGGPNGDGFQYRLNVQPVIPFSLSENWNVISRVIVPYVYQENRIGTTTQSGLSDTTASFFFAPKEPGPGGIIWGIGPDLYLPTATSSLLGAEKWGAGPTALLLKQDKGWTYGALVSHVWSFWGHQNRQEISDTFLQPFLAYQTHTHTTFTVNLESSYDWTTWQWTVPANFMVSQLVKIGKMPVNFQIGARYYAEKPQGGPDWGMRFAMTFVFPK
jgi:hypothetical protein